MRVLVAFDKFKDALSSSAACAIAADVLRAKHPEWEIDLCPTTDGGEGFCQILTHAAGGATGTIAVTGPLGASVEASFGLVPLANIPRAARTLLSLPDPGHLAQAAQPTVAIVEMATASGLALLAPVDRDPWRTTTLGTGELLRAAARPGVVAILLGIGGSATSDLGLGALAALGFEFRDVRGDRVHPPAPARWSEIDRVAGEIPRGFPPLRIACDVRNPLLGPRGAAFMFGPQKGLREADASRLDAAAANIARLLTQHCGAPVTLMAAPGAGAAGGLGFGLMAAMEAHMLPGFDLVAAWLDFEPRLAAADLILTGEGRFDESSLAGKGPGAIAAQAIALGKRVHVFAGAVSATPRERLSLHAITPVGTPLASALRDTSLNLATVVRSVF